MAALGEDHKGCLRTMFHLASSLYMQGEVEESIQIYRSCLEKQIKILGEDHYHTLLTKNAFGKGIKIHTNSLH